MTNTTTTTTDLDTPIRLECGKCSGTGSVSWGAAYTGVLTIVNSQGNRVGQRTVPKVCFDCNGVGYTVTTQRKLDRNEKARARAAAKREAAWVAGQVERDAAAAAFATAASEWATAHAEVVAALVTLSDRWNDTRTELAERGHLSDTTCGRVLEAAAAAPVPHGKHVVTGEVLTVKSQEGFRGRSVLKMLVRDDAGFKVWGSVPAAIGPAKGDRVTFQADLTPSDDDPTFGFYSRPTQARLV